MSISLCKFHNLLLPISFLNLYFYMDYHKSGLMLHLIVPVTRKDLTSEVENCN